MLQNFTCVSTALLFVTSIFSVSVAAQQKQTKEPVYRIAKNGNKQIANNEESKKTVKAKPASTSKKIAHPLDPALETATEGLKRVRAEVFDYTGMLVKRERVNGKLMDPEFIKFKIRNERVVKGKKVPFSIYMRFLKPKDFRGREVIWVKGQNGGKLVAHESPSKLIGKITARLDPDGSMAMKGNRYPIYEAGIENLIVKLIEKATRDRAAGDCIVNYSDTASINKRPCKMIELIHNEKRQPYEFHRAKVYIDKELDLPVRYVCWDWPSTKGGKPRLMEEYTYVNLKVNVGLTDKDFDHKNPKYDYRK